MKKPLLEFRMKVYTKNGIDRVTINEKHIATNVTLRNGVKLFIYFN